VRIFKNKWFSRFAQKEGITDDQLKDIVNDLEKGLWDADLGSGVYKKRVARLGEGKSGGYRTIVFFRSGERTFFQYAYPKSKRDNISEEELSSFKKTAKDLFKLDNVQLKSFVKMGYYIGIGELT
jgi:hypothetical protein